MVRLRTHDTYEIERNGKYIKSSKRIQEDVTNLVERAVLEGEVILDFDEAADENLGI